MQKKLVITLLVGICSCLHLQLVHCATSDKQQQQQQQQQQHLFSASIPYHEQLLPAEDHQRSAGSVGPSYQVSSISYQDSGKTYQPIPVNNEYVASSSAQAAAVNSFGGSASSGQESSYKAAGGYPSTVGGGYDTPIIQDSYGPPKPSYGPARPTYGPPSSSYGKPVGVGQPMGMGDSYAYHYQHYPAAGGGYEDHHHEPAGGVSTGGKGGKGGLFGGLGGLGGSFGGLGDGFSFGEGFGLDGLGGGGEGGAGPAGGLAAVKAVIVAIKAIIKFKSFFLLGLIFLLALPILLLFLPIPVITIGPTPGTEGAAGTTPAGGIPGLPVIGRQLLLSLTDKVLNAEECLERMICKLPQVPKNYQKQVKSLWKDYGTKYISNGRVQRGLEAYFESDADGQDTQIVDKEKLGTKQRGFKCNQKFKCSNKIF